MKAWMLVVLALVTGLGLAGCAHKAAGQGRLSSAGGGTPGPSLGAGSAGAGASAGSGSGGPSGSAGGGTPGTGTAGTTGPGTGTTAGLVVSAALTNPPSTTSSSCYHQQVQGTISVSGGPVVVQYRWDRHDGGSQPGGFAKFTGKGKQTMTVTDGVGTNGDALTVNYQDTLVVIHPTTATSNTVAWTETCQGIIAEIFADPVVAKCPYVTTFEADLYSTAGQETMNYMWHFGDGTTKPGTWTATKAGQEDPIRVTWPVSVQYSSPSAYMEITGPGGMTSSTVKATCEILAPPPH